MNSQLYKFSLILFVCLFLSGCASQKLAEGLPKLQGQNISSAISYLGYPNDQRKIAGKEMYTWEYQNSYSGVRPQYTPFNATAYGATGSTYIQGNTTSYVPETYNAICTIKLIVDKNNIITDWEWHGNEAGCSRYSEGLSRMVEENRHMNPQQGYNALCLLCDK